MISTHVLVASRVSLPPKNDSLFGQKQCVCCACADSITQHKCLPFDGYRIAAWIFLARITGVCQLDNIRHSSVGLLLIPHVYHQWHISDKTILWCCYAFLTMRNLSKNLDCSLSWLSLSLSFHVRGPVTAPICSRGVLSRIIFGGQATSANLDMCWALQCHSSLCYLVGCPCGLLACTVPGDGCLIGDNDDCTERQ